MTLKERLHAIQLLGYLTKVNKSPGMELIFSVHPDIIAVGSDWAQKDYLAQIDVAQEWLDHEQISIVYIPYVQTYPISSTEIKRRIRERIKD